MKKKNYCTTTGISTSFRLFHMAAGSAVLTAIQSAMSLDIHIIVQCTAVNMFLPIIFKEDARNVFLQGADMQHI